jgi:hypothetical protein
MGMSAAAAMSAAIEYVFRARRQTGPARDPEFADKPFAIDVNSRP